MFIEEIRPNHKESEQEYVTESGIDLEEFVKAVKKFDSLDEALAVLKESYTEYYIHNMEYPPLQEALKGLPLNEEDVDDDDDDPMLGVTRYNARITSGKKYVHYKGNYYSIVYDEFKKIWQPNPEFRSIVDAIKFAKWQIDQYMESKKS